MSRTRMARGIACPHDGTDWWYRRNAPSDGKHRWMCSECVRRRRNERRRKMRLQVIAAYGGKCQCSGITDPAFLCIDHVDGGGGAERKQVGATNASDFYRWLWKQGLPAGYQVLCANCNMAKEFSPGGCPHQRVPEWFRAAFVATQQMLDYADSDNVLEKVRF